MDKLINLSGGLGRVIALSGVVSKIAETEKLFLLTPYDFLFQFNKNVQCLDINNKFIFEENVYNKDYIDVEPYNKFDYYSGKEHISTVFNNLVCGDNKLVKPKIFTNERFDLEAEKWLLEAKKSGKKIMFIQPFSSTGGNKNENGEIEDLSFRSMKESFVKLIINEFKNEYEIFIIKDDSQFGFDGTKNIILNSHDDYYRFYSICKKIDVAICCDSFLHHLLEAVDSNAKTFVLWGGTLEKNQGYSDQINIRKQFVEFSEPLRINHNKEFYINKNYSCNNFGIGELEKIKKLL